MAKNFYHLIIDDMYPHFALFTREPCCATTACILTPDKEFLVYDGLVGAAKELSRSEEIAFAKGTPAMTVFTTHKRRIVLNDDGKWWEVWLPIA